MWNNTNKALKTNLISVTQHPLQSFTLLSVWVLLTFLFVGIYSDNAFALEHKPSTKIIGGQITPEGQYSFIAALTSSFDQEIIPFCGGSYIGDRYVLTAAHCVVDSFASSIDVWIGGHDITRPSGGTRVSVQQIYVHEEYERTSSDYDIAILELVNVPTGITPINLISEATQLAMREGDPLIIMGWGDTDITDGQTFPDVLNDTAVPLYNRADCIAAYFEGEITDRMVCAGFVEGGNDTCQGDSGGPLVYELNGEYYLSGVVSFGNGCAQAEAPGVYSRVASFLTWIEQKREGVSYRQHINEGFVENTYEQMQEIVITNVSNSPFSISNLNLSDENNLVNAVIESETCNGFSLNQGDTCLVRFNTAVAGAGEASVTLNADTSTDSSAPIEITVSLNAMEQSSLDMSSITGSNDEFITWYSGGDAVWEQTSAQVDSGGTAVSSGDIGDDQSSVLLAVIDNERVTGFRYRFLVSSELDFDFLNITLNGEIIGAASGTEETDFRTGSFNLADGVNRIAFSFDKDGSLDAGDDVAYIDTISLFVEPAPVVTPPPTQRPTNPTPPPASSSGGSMQVFLLVCMLVLGAFRNLGAFRTKVLRVASLMCILSLLSACEMSAELETNMPSNNKVDSDLPLATIYSALSKPDKVTFTTTSNGCTTTDNFRLLIEPSNDEALVSILLLKPDYCKAMPRVVSIDLPMDTKQFSNLRFANVISENPNYKKNRR